MFQLKTTKKKQNREAAPRAAGSSYDTLSTRDGEAIPIWRSGAGDPIAHLADIFDDLPGRKRSVRPTE